MSIYKVTLNGRTYEVEVEQDKAMLVDEYEAFAPVAAPAPVAATPAAAPAPGATAAGTQVVAPMPGNVLDIKVAQGATVQEGQVVVILEAMKMENEITAPCSGTVVQIVTSKGATVDTDAPLLVIG